jgi:hypothetical protein
MPNLCRLLLLVTSSALWIPGWAQPPQAPVSIKISAQNPTVKAASDIWIKVQITNISDQPVDLSGSINDMTGQDSILSFEVHDVNGKSGLTRKYKHPELAGHHPVMDRVLGPGKTLTEEQNLTRLYDTSAPGTYVVQVLLRPSQGSKEGVRSDPLRINVEP